MLFMIGMGLGDENDVTAKGDAAIRSSSLVVLEMYTSILGVNTERLVSHRSPSRSTTGWGGEGFAVLVLATLWGAESVSRQVSNGSARCGTNLCLVVVITVTRGCAG